MKKQLIRQLFLLLLPILAFAQGPDLINTVADTASLATIRGGDGQVMYLRQYSSTDTSGGGWFIVRTSSESTGTNYFTHPDPAKQWVRRDTDALEQGFVADTTALKLLSLGEGKTAYLKQLSSTNTNGGGWWVVADSSLNESYCIKAAPHPTAAMQWQRDIYRIRKAIYSNWANSLTIVLSVMAENDHLYINSGTYTISADLDIDIDNITIELLPGARLEVGSGIDCFNILGTVSATDSTTLTADAIMGTDSLQLTSSSDFSVGEWIYVVDPEWTTRSGNDPGDRVDINQVTKVNSNTIYLRYPTPHPFDSNSTKVFTADMRHDITFIGHPGSKIIGNWGSAQDDNSDAFDLQYTSNITFENVNVDSVERVWYVQDNREIIIRFCNLNKFAAGFVGYRVIEGEVYHNIFNRVSKTYGIAFLNGSRYPRIESNEIRITEPFSRAGASNGIVCQHTLAPQVLNNSIYAEPQAANYSISLNESCDYGIVDGNEIKGGVSDGIALIRTDHATVSDNKIKDVRGAIQGIGISMETGSFNTISGNDIFNCINGIKVQANPGYFNNINGNMLRYIKTNAIRIEATGLDDVSDTLKYGHVGYGNKIQGNTMIACWRYIMVGDSNYASTIMNNSLDSLVSQKADYGFSHSAWIKVEDSLAIGDGYWESPEIDMSEGDTSIVGYVDVFSAILKIEVCYTEDTSADTPSYFQVGTIGAGTNNQLYFHDSTHVSITAGNSKIYVGGEANHNDPTPTAFKTSRLEPSTPIKLSCTAKSGGGKMIIRLHYLRMI